MFVKVTLSSRFLWGYIDIKLFRFTSEKPSNSPEARRFSFPQAINFLTTYPDFVLFPYYPASVQNTRWRLAFSPRFYTTIGQSARYSNERTRCKGWFTGELTPGNITCQRRLVVDMSVITSRPLDTPIFVLMGKMQDRLLRAL